MTLNTAAWAIDGAIVNSALARTEAYAANSGSEGIISKGDLKVTQLATPGAGLQIAEGAGLVLNRYQTSPNQMYTITNPGVHYLGASDMPSISATEQTYIVAIAIGDPEFDQSGHPFMLATDPPTGEESTFDYVRAVVVTETSFNARSYPAIPLAKLVIPANTTVITDAMITNLRKLARPRTKLEMAHTPGPASENRLNGGGGNPGQYERWPNVAVLTCEVPEWAVKAKISGFLEDIKLDGAGAGKIRAQIEGTSLTTPVTNLNENDPGKTADRRNYSFAGEIDVKDIAGSTRTFSVEGTPNNTASKSVWWANGASSVFLQVYFEEQPA